jgi:hypothetical protein
LQEALSRLFVIDQRHDDLALIGAALRMITVSPSRCRRRSSNRLDLERKVSPPEIISGGAGDRMGSVLDRCDRTLAAMPMTDRNCREGVVTTAGQAIALPRLPATETALDDVGENLLRAGASWGDRWQSHLCPRAVGSRRMKPRSSSAVISRWIPDFEARLSASFISSKEGGIPASFSRWWMKRSSSCCLRVSIVAPRESKPKQNQNNHYLFQLCSATV